ncbi:hypothetical protein [Kitasatospora purpeofusca]|uniref:hypothetical protein n=1 Tax=Kitasatospora purpeofusca TaxID=67352 RepID=UPI00364A5835
MHTTTKKTPTYYLATRPDGTVLTAGTGPDPISLLTPDGDGIVHHPNPAADGTWYSGTRFTLTTRPGEALAGMWSWPARLFVVEPLGEGGHNRHTGTTRALRVVAETDAHQALGPRGLQVLEHLEALPGLARRWAAAWTADPATTAEAYETWRLCTHHDHTSGRRAVALAGAAARHAHREAADTTLRRIAIDRATDAAQAAGADRSAAHYAAMRAAHLTQAVLTQDRLTDYVLTALRGGTLDRTPTAAA